MRLYKKVVVTFRIYSNSRATATHVHFVLTCRRSTDSLRSQWGLTLRFIFQEFLDCINRNIFRNDDREGLTLLNDNINNNNDEDFLNEITFRFTTLFWFCQSIPSDIRICIVWEDNYDLQVSHGKICVCHYSVTFFPSRAFYIFALTSSTFTVCRDLQMGDTYENQNIASGDQDGGSESCGMGRDSRARDDSGASSAQGSRGMGRRGERLPVT